MIFLQAAASRKPKKKKKKKPFPIGPRHQVAYRALQCTVSRSIVTALIETRPA